MAAVVRCALMLSVVVELAGCSAENSESGRAAGSASPGETESSAPPEPSQEENDDAEVAEGVRTTSEGVLKPGRYETSLFEPRATFKVSKGWRLS
jgi:hypothetical protein